MGIQAEVTTAEFKASLKRLELGSKSVAGAYVPIYKLHLELDEIDRKQMDNMFHIHKKQKDSEITIADTVFNATVKGIALGSKTTEGKILPIYKVVIEMQELDRETLRNLYITHKAQETTDVKIEHMENQLSMVLSETASTIDEDADELDEDKDVFFG